MKLILLIALLSFVFTSAGIQSQALSLPESAGDNRTNLNLEKQSISPVIIKEVPPPVIVQQNREKLDTYHPKIELISPTSDEILNDQDWELVLGLKNWPISIDSDNQLGPHVVVQQDDFLPIRVTKVEGGQVTIPMQGLKPGSHRFSAYMAYPWGEAVKQPAARIQWRLHSLKRTKGTQPENDSPWLTSVSPSEISTGDLLLIDALIWNAPLQGLKEGDDKWRLKISIDDQNFFLDREEAIWIEGPPFENKILQLELVNSEGVPMQPYFNNQIKLIKVKSE